ncbi:hypothetical protein P3X46_008115 [Hevea brasiliensis]|uniref:glutathione transferase n=2 Tax=Hevea brasiliensis TaxID=3981 RepID=A0A6A6KGP2_HEVBR|nr:probable glutathione S-transferase [Hevea brasiliensis]KAF2288062.1 hypothetical protein GH714_004195 [Hevea brasiliensis]KAJ9179794.1 hypothetical protein P3X46_008115 [Hevea brasiliensis]
MAAGEEVKLLGGWFSPFSHRVELALKLKGIPHQVLQEDLSNKSPLLLKNNPVYEKIPVLIHNQKPISESFVILEYIDETWKRNPLLPQDPHDKALARFWASFIDDKLAEAVRRTITTQGEQQQQDVKKATEALEILEGELKIKGKRFFGGETLGIVDIMLGWISIWLGVIEEFAGVQVIDPENFPVIEKWKRDFLQVPAVKESLPQRDLLVGYFENFRRFKLASVPAPGN